MKRRLSALLLILVLSLTACSVVGTSEVHSDTQVPQTTAQAEEKETAEPLQASEPTDAKPTWDVTDEDLTDETPEDVQDPNDTSEDLGDSNETPEDLWPTEPEPTEPETTEPPEEPKNWTVHTDYSAYRPYQAPKAVYTRLREGPLDHFEPSDDYGLVYPYAAARLFSDYDWEHGKTYGLADARGRILTDGIYLTARVMAWYDSAEERSHYHPYWVVSQVDNVRIETWEYEGETYSWPEADQRYGVISADGSFALDCVYSSVQAYSDGFLCVSDMNAHELEFYDLDGTLRFTGADIRWPEDASYWYMQRGEGLSLLTIYRDDGSYEAWFLDDTGARVLGPYAGATPFQEGLACVTQDGVYYGYIDRTGNWALEPVYRSNQYFLHGLAVQTDRRNQWILIDRSGRVLVQAGSEVWFNRVPCGWQETTYYENTRTFYNDAGEFLISGSDSLNCLDRDTFWYKDWSRNQTVVLRPGQDLELRLPSLGSLEPGVAELEGELVQGYLGLCYDDEDILRYYFIAQDLSAWYALRSVDWSWSYYNYRYFEAVDSATGEIWQLCWTGTCWRGLSDKGRTLDVPLRFENVSVCGGLVWGVTDDASCCATLDGEVVLRVPLDSED